MTQRLSLPICEKELNKARKKFNEAEKLVMECNTWAIDKISKMEKNLEDLKNLCPGRPYPGRSLEVLIEDIGSIKSDFINNCICKRGK